MIRTLNYNFDFCDDYEYCITQNKDDIIDYLLFKKFGEQLGRFRDKEYTDYEKLLEEKWKRNEIDEVELYSFDYDFKE